MYHEKIHSNRFSAVPAISLAACSNGQQQDSSGADATEVSLDGNILITYFSMPETDGVDTVSSASRVVADSEVLGNNQYIAQLI